MVVSVVEQSSTRASSATTHGNRWMLTPSSMQQEDQTVMIEHQHCGRCDRPQTAASRLTEPHPPNVGTHPHRAGGSISPRMARVPPGITPHRSPRMAYSQSPRSVHSSHCGVSPHSTAPCVIISTCARYRTLWRGDHAGVDVGRISRMRCCACAGGE